ncbi:MAG: CBS domain-containing protein [Clostridia bacterium]|jgi:predicted transcriptional regulator|nr:CBS domain-containing protein [Clostridia bacterium]
MNLLFFLTPKCDVCVLEKDYTLRQAIEKMRTVRHTAVPVIDAQGYYCGSVSEGDLLRGVLETENAKEWESTPITAVMRTDFNPPVTVMTGLEELLRTATNQNFVPVVDDRGMFIGIVTRKAIMQYYIDNYFDKLQQAQ